MRDSNGEHRRALAANVAGYDVVDEARYIAGAPHVRHLSIRNLHAELVDLLLSHLPQMSRPTVLDLGAGAGNASKPWLRAGVRLTAVDSSTAMLGRLLAAARPASVETVAADVFDFLTTCDRSFDVVTLTSTIHHVPDYLSLIRKAAGRVAPHGALLTFQDPIRYDRVPSLHRTAAQLCYLTWRLGQGDYRRGLRTRWRRFRGVYSSSEPSDLEEYHVVRDGVDAEAVRDLLAQLFEEVRVIEYWSTQSPVFQWLGEHLRVRSTFGVLALDRQI